MQLRTSGLRGPDQVVIFGSGFTGSRAARLLRARGLSVRELHRGEVRDAASSLKEGCLVLHSLPTLPDGLDRFIMRDFRSMPSRVVYLSTTSVYGRAAVVNESTPLDAAEDRARLRIETEQAVQAGPWSSLILRPAGIYGPGRGVHTALREGRFVSRGEITSRIHVDDLAAHCAAGLLGSVEGAYPVADEHPCSSSEVAHFAAELLHLPFEPSAHRQGSGRRVDGAAIRKLLGITLRYPSYRTGIPASLGEET